MNIVFFGTPDFAVASLNQIVQSNHNVLAVVTTTDKMTGRNNSKLSISPVKQFALDNELKILQPKSLKSNKFLHEIKKLNPEVFVVVAFRMMPEVLWSIPPKGTFNLHGSLLPAYRGAAPINWAIINGETKTGVTTFFIDKEIDTGRIILQKETSIGSTEEVDTVYDRLKNIGSEAVVETLDLIESNQVATIPQDESKASMAPKIFHPDCMIDSRMNVHDAFNLIRGVNPYPGAWFYFFFKEMKVIKYEKMSQTNPDTDFIKTDFKTYLHLHFEGGYISIKECKYEGKKAMSITDFFNGFKKPETLKTGG